MKLRQKSYLQSALFVAAVLELCMLLLTVPNVVSTFSAFKARAVSEEKALALAIDGLFEKTDRESWATNVRGFSRYHSKGSSFAVGYGETTWIATEPVPEPIEAGQMVWNSGRGQYALTLSDTLSNGAWLRFRLDATDEIRRMERQTFAAVAVSTALCFAIAAVLYGMSVRINRPIDRLAHELRTPLTVIRGYGELLERAKLTPEQQHDAASYIVSESMRLGEISQKLLTMSDARENAYRPEQLDLRALAAHLEKTYPTLATTIEWPSMTGDRALMLSMLGNLIGNAVKASAPDSPVYLTAKPGEIEIRDCGKGMNAEQLAYVNDPSHAKNPSVRSGLGVPLCHEIAALHRAKLVFTSKEGEGTTATVRFGV